MIPFYRKYTTHLIKAYTVTINEHRETPKSYAEAFRIIEALPEKDKEILVYVFGESGECTNINTSWLEGVADMFNTTTSTVWHTIRHAQAALAYNLGLVGLDAFDFD